MRIFSEKEIREKVQLDASLINEIEGAFTDLVVKDVQMPPIMRVDIDEHNGEMDAKTAYIPGYDMFALKVSTGFFNNYKLGLPSTGGLMFLINALNGQPEVILHDNGYLTDVRTAAAGGIAAKYMANEKLETVGVIGAGAQGRFQLEALSYVRNFKHVIVYSKTPERLREFKQEVENKLAVTVTIAESAEEVVRNSELLITATPATTPVIQKEWIPKGMHITAMGSDAEHKQELDPEIFGIADKIVCDVIAQCEVLGELNGALKEGVLTNTENVIELGEITEKKQNIRTSENQITVADLTGTGAQDTKIALYAYKKLMEEKEVDVP